MAVVLVGWRDFYAVVAGASATLAGRVFVGICIQVPREPLDAGARLLGTMAAFVVLMFVVGTENAWDLLLGTGLGPRDRGR